jgi:hypothetical protein
MRCAAQNVAGRAIIKNINLLGAFAVPKRDMDSVALLLLALAIVNSAFGLSLQRIRWLLVALLVPSLLLANVLVLILAYPAAFPSSAPTPPYSTGRYYFVAAASGIFCFVTLAYHVLEHGLPELEEKQRRRAFTQTCTADR